MWDNIFQEYISDHVAFVVHLYLLSGDLLATWAVAAGIIWENVPDLRKIAHRLVIWGVVAETMCSLALFSFDEGISGAQQSKIIALDNDLLQEQRSTARYRWEMETVVRAVLPRHLIPDPTLAIALKKLGPINVAIVDKVEPRSFGEKIVGLFEQAGIMGRVIWLPDENDRRMTTGFSGVSMYAATENGRKVAEILWRAEHIAGGIVGGITPIGWEAIPKNEDTLMVGINDAVWQPQNGQPGEGLDAKGRPVPAPQ